MGSSIRRSEGFPHATTKNLDIVIVSYVPDRARKIEQHYVIVMLCKSDIYIDRSFTGRSCNRTCPQAPSITARPLDHFAGA